MAVFGSWLLVNVSSLVCRCQPFPCKSHPRTYLSNPKPGHSAVGTKRNKARRGGWVGRVGAERREAGERRGRAMCPGRTSNIRPPAHRRRLFWTTFGPSLACRCNLFSCKAFPERTNVMINKFVESEARTYHGQVEAARHTAGRRDGAGPGRTGRRRVGSPRRQPSLLLSRGIEDNCLERCFGSTNKGNLCKPMEEQSPRMTTGLSVVDDQFIRGTSAALRSWLLTSGPSPVCLRKPFFHARHIRELPAAIWPPHCFPRLV